MDVDLLRPGTVPLSPDTILWFEFLLDPTLLKKHLSKPNPEPTSSELIIEFLAVDNSVGPSTNGGSASERIVDVDAPLTPPELSICLSPVQLSRKQLALKILALKVAASLKWNLTTLENTLPPQTQQQLMQDLVYMATDTAYLIPPQEIPQHLVHNTEVQFAMTLYHQWVLRFPVKAALYTKTNKIIYTHIPGLQTDSGYSPLNPHFEKILRFCENSRMQSIRFLEDMLTYYEPTSSAGRHEARKIKIPTMETFMHLTEDNDEMRHDWNSSDVTISQYELAMQIHFDLCTNYFFYGQHDLAKKHILGCRENSNLLEREASIYGYGPHKTLPWGDLNFANALKEDILGYMRALNLSYEVLNEEPTLLQKLVESVANHYTGIIAILQADNLTREIPLVHRQVVELDIQGSSSSGAFTVARDLLNRVSALNAVRYALEGGIPSTQPEFLNKFITTDTKFFELLLWALAPVLTSPLTEDDWEKLKIFFLHFVTSRCTPIDRLDEFFMKHLGDQGIDLRRKLVSDEELEFITNEISESEDENVDLPKELLTDDWETPEFDFKTVPELEMGKTKKRLIEASTADDVGMCLVKLAKMAPSMPLWKISPSWKPAGALGMALTALPRGFLRDFGYIVSGTARARAETGNPKTALSLLLVLEAEARYKVVNGNDSNLYRLCRLVSWEVLLLQVNVMLSEWPHHRMHLPTLVTKSKACIAAVNSGENILPRQQVIEACWSCLVNAGEWDTGVECTRGSGLVAEAAAALCAACLELQRGKGATKFPRQLWDMALSVFATTQTGIEGTSGGMPAHSRDAPSDLRLSFNMFLSSLREPLAVSVVLSLLAKIYNVLTDDSTSELVVEYMNLWPSSISNMNTYNAKIVLESITELLAKSVRLYPYNVSWLRLWGDIEACSSRWPFALRRYLCALAVGSWYFGKRCADEAGIARRAARCLHALPAPAAAAALCQLPAEPDYNTAFKFLAEKTPNATDAGDGYYGCIWDGTLLEVATAYHARRSEGGRRTRAVRAAGALELNANNSDDIQREAAAVRRARLLRALTTQFVG